MPSSLRPTVKVRRWEINKKAPHGVPHRHKFFRLLRAAALETGRGSGSPPGPPHSHTGSERESRSWNLNTSVQTPKRMNASQCTAPMAFCSLEDDVTHWCRSRQASRRTRSDSSICNFRNCSYSGAHRDEVSGRTRSDLGSIEIS